MKLRKRDFYEQAEAVMIAAFPPDVKPPVKIDHHFSDGIYLRTMTIPGGVLVLGHKHKTRHLTQLLKGRLTVVTSDGQGRTIEAPCIFESAAGVGKVGYSHSECIVANSFPNPDNCKNVNVLERRLVTKSRAFRAWERSRKELA